MVHPKHHHSIAVVVLLGIVLLFVLIVISPYFYKPQLNPELIKTRTFYSELLNFSIEVPNEYTAEEKFTGVIIIDDNQEGQIIVSRNGTNNDSLEDYLLDIAESNDQTHSNKEYLTINNIPAVRLNINGKRHYIYYKDNIVYSIYTDSPDLYDDLDQIAQSFKYLPPENSQN